MQLKILQEQLTILKNETNNLISVAIFLLGIHPFEDGEELEEIRRKRKKKKLNMEEKIKKEIEELCTESIKGKFIQVNLDGKVGLSFKKFREGIKKNLREKGKKLNEDKEETVDILYSLYSLRNKLELYIRQVREIYLEVSKEDFCSLWPTEVLLFVSNMITEINNILTSLNVIVKILKFRRENAYQGYIPIPLLHRRYRLYNLHRFTVVGFSGLINEFIKKNRENFIDKEDIRFLVSSDYDIGDSVTERIPITLIRGSFFWREQSSFLPILVHEIAHRIYEHLQKHLKKRITRRVRYLGEKKWRGVFEYNLERLLNLWEEIFADAVGFILLGDAYLMSMLFAGLWGLKYSCFSGIQSEDRKYYSFQPTLITTGDITAPETGILRILFLAELRRRLKKDKEFSGSSSISKDVGEYLEGVLDAINDLYPVKDESGLAFCTFPLDKRKLIGIKALFLKGLSSDFVDIFEIGKLWEKILSSVKGKSVLKLKPPESTFWNVEWAVGKFNGREKLVLKVGEDNYLLLPAPSERDSFWMEIPANGSEVSRLRFEKGNLYELAWFCNMKILSSRNQEDISEWFLWEGRIFRSYYLLKRFPQLLRELKEGKKDNLKLKLGEIVCIKCRGVYEKSGKEVLEGIKNFSFEGMGKPELFFTLGAFDFMFFWKEYKTAKKDEENFYKELHKRFAFADRHSVLFLEGEGRQRDEVNDLKPVVLVKIKSPSLEEGKVDLDLGNIRGSLMAISSGWETLVFTPDIESLSQFFCEFMIKELLAKDWVNRPETILGIPLSLFRNPKKEFSKRNGERLRIALSLRLDITGNKSKVFKKLLEEGWALFAGRFDVVYAKGISDEKTIPYEIVNILGKESLKEVSIRDMRIDVIFGDKCEEEGGVHRERKCRECP